MLLGGIGRRNRSAEEFCPVIWTSCVSVTKCHAEITAQHFETDDRRGRRAHDHILAIEVDEVSERV
jgi:hypothetical protein